MNALELVKDLFQFLWAAVLMYAATPEGQAKLAEIISDFGLDETPGAVSTPSKPPRRPVEKPSTAAMTGEPESEAERQARLGIRE